MQVTETLTEGLKRGFKVVISAGDIDEKIDGRLQELGTQVKVPGFRPGKVPLTILKQRFGQSVLGEVLERAVGDSSSQALQERGLRPAVQPKIEISPSFKPGQDLEYSMEMELLPDIEPMDFTTLEVERLKIALPEKDVEEALERIAAGQKSTKPLEKPRKSKSGDILVMDFAGTVHGEALPGMAAEDHHLELGTNSFVGDFEDQLIGVNIGDEPTVTVTFPDEYVNDKLSGQEAVFECKIKDILESTSMPIDDSLAEALGEENLATLKGRVSERLQADYDGASRARMKRQLLDLLAEGHDFPIPESMAQLEFDTIWKQIEEAREKGEIDPDDEGKDEEELKTEYRKIADRRVLLGLLLSEVGRTNAIEVSQDELNQAVVREAQKYQGQEQQVFKFFQENQEAIAQLRAPLFEDKVIDYIADLAKVVEREVTPEELLAEEKAAEESAAGDTAAKKPAKKKAAAKKPGKKAAAEKKPAKKKAAKKEAK